MSRPFEDEVRVGDVRVDWDAVLPGLMVIKDLGAYWRIEDIYAMCCSGEAFLYMFEGGFCICGKRRNRFTLEIELHLYAVYSQRDDSCMRFLPYFEAMAHEIGATRMTMESKRKAFELYGWEIDYHCFKRRI